MCSREELTECEASTLEFLTNLADMYNVGLDGYIVRWPIFAAACQDVSDMPWRNYRKRSTRHERTLREINEADWEFAHHLLQCITVASRPLHVEELAEFLAFDFEAGPIPKFHEGWRVEDPVEAVLSTCSTLFAVVHAKDWSIIQFSHFSVKEFLTSTRLAKANDPIPRRYHISTTSAHTLVAQACLGILLHLDENITADALERFPLIKYAAEHWLDHTRFENVSRKVEDGMKQLFHPNRRHLAVWVWIYDPYKGKFPTERAERPSSPRGIALHYAAHCGLGAIVKFLVTEHSQDVHARGLYEGSTSLFFASERGHVEVARVLLEHSADATAKNSRQ